MPFAEPELFADGACGRPLPAGELLQEFRFGQFSPIKRFVNGREVPVVVGEDLHQAPERAHKNGGPQSARGAPASITFAALLEEESGGQAAPPATRIIAAPEQVAAAIASGRVADRYQAWDVELSPPAVQALLAGRPAEVRTTDGGDQRRLVIAPTASLLPREPKDGEGGGGEGGGGDPGPGPGPGPKVRIQLQHTIPEEELPAYLIEPWVIDEAGQRMSITLGASHVTELTTKGHTELTLPDYHIRLTVKKAIKKDPEPTGGGTTGSTGGGTTTTDPPKEKPDEPAYDPEPVVEEAQRGILVALYFEWKQSWTLKGFSRGRLLQSLALGPQEDATIELFTWDRRRKTLEQSSEAETEQSVEDEEKTQDAAECIRELTKKDEFELKAGGSLDAQYNGGTVNIKAGITGGFDSKSNAEDVAKLTSKALKEGVHKSAAKVRSKRSSKVSETTESGSEERITRKVRNPNLCHTLNLDYFEILTHYLVTTEFNEDGMRFCAMIPNPVGQKSFPHEFIRRHEGALRDALIDRSVAAGFEAVRFLRARQAAVEELGKRRQRREIEPLPAAPEKTLVPQTAVTEEESAANNFLANLQRAAKAVMASTVAGKLDNALTAIGAHNRAINADLDAGKKWLAQQLLLRYFSQLMLELSALAQAGDNPQIRDWGPRLDPVAPQPTDMPKPSQLGLEPQEVKEGIFKPVVEPRVGPPWNWGWWWGELKRVGLMEPEDAGLGALVEQFARVYREFLKAQKSKGGTDPGAKLVQQTQQAQDRLSDEDRLENDFPMRDYAIALERAEVLEAHLNEHADHYSFALFQALPPQEQLNHIERAMAGIATGFDPGFFQPRVVSQIGKRLVVPLNHEIIPDAAKQLAILKDRINVPTDVDTVLLPSPGLTIEARLGHCSAAEHFIEETRELDLELRRVQIRQAEAEAERLEKRLGASQLDDPKPQLPVLQLELEQHNGVARP